MCPVRNSGVPSTCVYIYVVLKNAFKFICNINLFVFSSERQDAQGRGNRRSSHEDPLTPPILEDHLRHQHLWDVRRLPTPHPPPTKRSPKERGKPGGSGGQGGYHGQGGVGGRGSSSPGPTAVKICTIDFPSFLTNRKFLLTFLFLLFFCVLSLFSDFFFFFLGI